MYNQIEEIEKFVEFINKENTDISYKLAAQYTYDTLIKYNGLISEEAILNYFDVLNDNNASFDKEKAKNHIYEIKKENSNYKMKKLSKEEKDYFIKNKEFTLNFGMLIDILGNFCLENSNKIDIEINGFGNPHSYRGYYNCIAFEPKVTTVREMYESAIKVLDTEMTGYKGGGFLMDRSVGVYIANVGTFSFNDDELTYERLINYLDVLV